MVEGAIRNAEHRSMQPIGVLSGGGADGRITVEQPSTKMGAGSNIGVGTLLKKNSVTQASLKSSCPTLAKPRHLWSRQIRDGETIVAGSLGVCQQPTLINPEPYWEGYGDS